MPLVLKMVTGHNAEIDKAACGGLGNSGTVFPVLAQIFVGYNGTFRIVA